MHYYCTYFDYRFLVKGLTLYQSLSWHCRPFRLWILCMDRISFEFLAKADLENVSLIALEDLEAHDQELPNTKQERTLIEYYFTCTPILPLFILERFAEVDLITYLDADIFFFDSPKLLHDELLGYSIGIIPHRFPPNLKYREVYGIYNVGWLSFRKDHYALDCLRWWRERCIEWCYDRIVDGRFADQKYLDDWPNRFQRVLVLQHKGANLAPWNLGNYRISQTDGHIWVDEAPLIFFHFHGLKAINKWLYDPNLADYDLKATQSFKHMIFKPYINMLQNNTSEVASVFEGINAKDSIRFSRPNICHGCRMSLLKRLQNLFSSYLIAWMNVRASVYIVSVNGKIL